MNTLPARWKKHRPSAEPKPPRIRLTPGNLPENAAGIRRACDEWLAARGLSTTATTPVSLR